MWVTKLLISQGKIRIFCPKLAFLFILGRLIWCPVGGLVGGCGARAVSRKTPIYFIIINITKCYVLLPNQVGCRLHWDAHTDQTIPTCHNETQFKWGLFVENTFTEGSLTKFF